MKFSLITVMIGLLSALLYCQDSLQINYPPPVKIEKDSILDRATAKRAMIYPGCELYENSNRDLYRCFNQRFYTDLLNNFDDFEIDEGVVRVTVAFEIGTDGKLKLTDIHNTATGEKKKYFDNLTLIAFERLINQFEENHLRIQPGIKADGTPAVMMYTIPVTFRAN